MKAWWLGLFVFLLVGTGGAALCDTAAPPIAGSIDASVARAVRWLGGVRLDPFSGAPADLRFFTVEAESWHRLAVTEADPGRRAEFERETIERLAKVLDQDRLESVLSAPEGSTIFTELLVLAARCREHGLDPEPIRAALRSHEQALLAEARRVPPSIGALYAAYMLEAGLQAPFLLEEVRSRGLRALRPPEVELGLAEIYYLTHEIFADCDYGLGPLAGHGDAERAYLQRVLPFYAIFYAGLGNLDIVGELLACLHAAGFRDTYAYREGIRVLLERQNADGSFGNPGPKDLGRPVRPSDFLHPTMNAITILALERRSLQTGAP
jgi:hypothetical protein